LQLINDVLDLSKVEAGKLEFFPGEVDLAALLKEVVDILKPAVQRKRIELNVEVDAALGALLLDAARLKQVLFNYLSNAIKFTPNQGRVWVRARRADEAHLRIEVEDTGIGIAAADIPRLFSEFHQLNAGLEDENGGTGLGLALTRRLIEAQGGSVGVTSTMGHGSVFHLVLNRVHGTDQALGAAGPPAASESRQRRLLMIEDPTLHQSDQAAALAKAGFAVDAPATGEQTFQYAQLRAYDAMTVNLERRRDAGLDLLAQIRRRGARRECPVVGLSMPAPAGGEVTFAISDLLSKPMQTDEIVAAMGAFRFPPPRRAKLMVIDDDLVSLALMQATLGAIDIDSVCVQSGREAFASLNRQQRPDAIILDLLMPELDGFEVLDVLRSRPDWRDIPVFIWTSMIITETEYARLAQSAHAIVSKGGGTIHAMLEDLQRRYHPPTHRAVDG
jgi:CheY-like chemotaxis protein/anti-sigma regulatory factor (Ser/Thr protein kinase)